MVYFPGSSNTQLSATEVLRTYKQQSYLEKRHSTLKTVEQVCPIYLKKPQRIEAMLFLYFVGLMIISLIERNIRNRMNDAAANNFDLDLVISASDKQTVLPSDRVLLPNKNQTTSLQEQYLFDEQTTNSNSNEMICSVVSKPTSVLKKQSALSEINSQPTLPQEQIFENELLSASFESTTQPIKSSWKVFPENNQTALFEPITQSPESCNQVLPKNELLPVSLERTTQFQKSHTQIISENDSQSAKLEPITQLPESCSQNPPENNKQTVSFERTTQFPESCSQNRPENSIQTVPSVPFEHMDQPSKSSHKVVPSSQVALPILPQGMKTKTPTWGNIKYLFRLCFR